MNNTAENPESQRVNVKLSPKQQYALDILLRNPEGILSNELRRAVKTNNIAQVIRKLRLSGIGIDCIREHYLDSDGDEGVIGRYVLASSISQGVSNE